MLSETFLYFYFCLTFLSSCPEDWYSPWPSLLSVSIVSGPETISNCQHLLTFNNKKRKRNKYRKTGKRKRKEK
jgi:hypothetical protein